MKIGLLTGGGDCPGLNAIIRAIVKKGEKLGHAVLGIKNGWAGLVKAQVEPLTGYSVSGILPKGGTILGTSRTNPFKNEENVQRCLDNFRRFGIEAIIAIGGEDTLGVALRFHKLNVPVVGCPKTIDNDLSGTDRTFGFDTAVNIAMEAIDRLHSTAESHHRVMVVEVMGRHSGWIAIEAGIAGGADYIIIPEKPYDIDEVCRSLKHRRDRGKDFSIVVVAEGATPKDSAGLVTQTDAKDEFGHVRLGGVGALIAAEIEKRSGLETRVTILGYVQRGGSPTAYDRVLAIRYGLRAMDLVLEKKFGRMVALSGTRIVDVPLEDGTARARMVDDDLYRDAEIFFG